MYFVCLTYALLTQNFLCTSSVVNVTQGQKKAAQKGQKKACTGELVLFLGGLSGKWTLKKVGTCFEDSDRGSLRSSLVPCYTVRLRARHTPVPSALHCASSRRPSRPRPWKSQKRE